MTEDEIQTEDLSMRELSDEGVRELLESEPYGVLSMCDDGVPYGIPMSFGYHDGDVYFEFGTVEGGRKFEVLETNPVAALTVYALDRSRWGDSTANLLPTGFAWASIVVTGKIEEVENPSEDVRDAVFEARQPSPANPWGGSMAETELSFHKMDVDTAEGRVAGGGNPAED
ncbi:MAG: nitroimidazol reductase NimA-like FMN-containing flavoprotein [Methanobacteriota archaeon]|jgi:nitroimidazol reductase NimA-like FMN-containing flavoprotein (pyridoxamine 5'-phosphate oxidase superfamily)